MELIWKNLYMISYLVENKEKVISRTNFNDIVVYFVVKLCSVDYENHCKNKQFPLNENDNNFDENFNIDNSKK